MIFRFYQPGVLDKQFVILFFLTLPFIDIITDVFQAGKAETLFEFQKFL